MQNPQEIRDLLHRLNNQLGVILAHAELLEAKAPDDQGRRRASAVVQASLEALTITNLIRDDIEKRDL